MTKEKDEILSGSDYPVSVSFFNLSALRKDRMEPHRHTEIEILFIEHGALDVSVNSSALRLAAGMGLMINQNITHSVNTAGSVECSFYSVRFEAAYLFGYGNTLLTAKYLTPVTGSRSLCSQLLRDTVAWQQDLLEHTRRIIALNREKGFGYELEVKAHLCFFWTALLTNALPQSVVSDFVLEPSMDFKRVRQAILFIENNYEKPITLEEISASIHVSKSECCRCFKRSLRLSPMEYLIKYRILEAAKKLRTGGSDTDSISSLALSVGINHASYFNKLFKKYIGCTPTEYREYLKKAPDTGLSETPFQIPQP